jgi:hypothetical protein
MQNLYDQDFYSWLITNSQLIKEKRFSEIDVENIVEELESMGKSEKRELMSRLAVLLAHLLKWSYQPEQRSNSWKYTIEEQRRAVEEVLEDSPSLKYQLDQKFNDAYSKAVLIAARETGFAKAKFPQDCPFTWEQAINDNFWPNDL